MKLGSNFMMSESGNLASSRSADDRGSYRWLIPLLLPAVCHILAGCQQTIPSASVADAANASYRLESAPVRLVDGLAEVPAAPGSSSVIRTQIIGEPMIADLNRDQMEDAVVVLAQQTGGTGTFYYLAAAVATPQGPAGTDGLFLGDRIAVDSVAVVDGRISLQYRTRAPSQSFAEAPSVERVRDFVLAPDGQTLAELARNFEGEADPERMSLTMKTWVWVRTRYNDDTVIEPREAGAFTLTFVQENVQGSTDCNGFRGAFTVSDHRISFEQPMAATQKFCADSQETAFLQMLSQVQSFLFTGDGRLILELQYDSGGMEFR
jgi:heat shock protein HslJ